MNSCAPRIALCRHGFLLLIVCYGAALLAAQDSSCGQIAALSEMARAKTEAVLLKSKERAGDTYRAQFVFAFRAFEIRPTGKAEALRLLKLLPKDDSQQTTLMTLGDSLCDAEALADMKSLDRVGQSVGREFAKAVAIVPRYMPSYVAYSMVAVGDPHSDFAVRMASVCKQNRSGFLKAVRQLQSEKRQWFAEHVMDPNSCRPLALPEAE